MSFRSTKNLILLLLLVGSLPAAAQQKNVLLIIIDDLRPELNCYGQQHIHSPNIDALAANGVLFQNAFVQQAVCPASRASFLSSARPNTTGTDYPYSSYFVNEFLSWNPTVQRHFFESGYTSTTLGKVHHGAYKDKTNLEVSVKTYRPPSEKVYALPENKTDTDDPKPATERANMADTAYRDGHTTLEAISQLSKMAKSNTPFFMAVGFYKPHLPFAAPAKYWDLYKRDEIPIAPFKTHPTNSPDYTTAHTALHNYTKENDQSGHILSDEYARELRHGYFACVSYIDAQVGLIIQHLKDEGLYDSTVIVLMSDHGYHLGDAGMWGKSTNFDMATRIPLIISNYNDQKGVCAGLVEAIDVYPSLCEMAGITSPKQLEGNSLVPLVNNPSLPWKKAILTQYPRSVSNEKLEGYAIRTKRYKYVEWRNRTDDKVVTTELYDHKTDPFETKNIAGEKAHKTLLDSLELALRDDWKKNLPDGIINWSAHKLAPEAKTYEKNAPYILTQKPIDVMVNHQVQIDYDVLDSVIDRDNDFPLNFVLKVQGGEHYTLSDNLVIPEIGYTGLLSVPVTITDPDGNESNTYPLKIEVRAPRNSSEIVSSDLKELKIGFAPGEHYNYVTQNIELPKKGKHGSFISWESSDASVIDTHGVFVNNLAPNGGLKAHQMTATLSKDSIAEKQSFDLTLWPLDHGIMVSPNPCQGDFTLSAYNGFSQMEVFDLLGNLIFQEQFDFNQTHTASLELLNGVYLVRLSDKENNNTSGTTRLMVNAAF